MREHITVLERALKALDAANAIQPNEHIQTAILHTLAALVDAKKAVGYRQ